MTQPKRPIFSHEGAKALCDHAATAPLQNMHHAAAIDNLFKDFLAWHKQLPAEHTSEQPAPAPVPAPAQPPKPMPPLVPPPAPPTKTAPTEE